MWCTKYIADGDKTRYATMEEEMKALRLEVAELKIERDMLKKATAYFAYMAEMGLVSIHNRHKTRSLTDSRKCVPR
jgi:transposase-like protein